MGPLRQLTPREAEVLELLALGLSNKSICAQLGISEGTAKRHCTTLFIKLGVRNRTQAAMRHVTGGTNAL